MRGRLKIVSAGIGVCFVLIKANAQDIHFSQYLQAPLLANPACTGVFEGDHRADINYRSQWNSVTAPFKTMDFSYDTHLFKTKHSKGSYLGVGLCIFKDKAGDADMTQFQANGSISGVLKTGENSAFSVGLQGGYSQRSINYDNLKWGTQYDGKAYNAALPSTENNGFTSFGYADVSAGVLWHYNQDQESFAGGHSFSKIDIGAAVQHVNRPRLKYFGLNENLKMKFVTHASAEIDLSDSRLTLVPSVIYMQQGTLNEIVVGGMLKYRIDKRTSRYTGFGKSSSVSFGTQYRYKDAFIPMFMFQKEDYAIGLSYDFNTSGLSNVSNHRGGYEISFCYLLGKKK